MKKNNKLVKQALSAFTFAATAVMPVAGQASIEGLNGTYLAKGSCGGGAKCSAASSAQRPATHTCSGRAKPASVPSYDCGAAPSAPVAPKAVQKPQFAQEPSYGKPMNQQFSHEASCGNQTQPKCPADIPDSEISEREFNEGVARNMSDDTTQTPSFSEGSMHGMPTRTFPGRAQ